MSTFATFKTNASLETEGIVIDFGSAGSFCVKRAGGENTAFVRALEAKVRPYRRMIQNETMDEDRLRTLLIEAFVDHVLRGWENVTDSDDLPLPYTRENAINLMTELPELFTALREEASKVSNFLKIDREKAAGE